MRDDFFEAMKDSDWGESVTEYPVNEEAIKSELLKDCDQAVKREYADYNMKVTKSWAEYAKDINRMRAQLRYMKKSVCYRGGCYSPYENQRDIIDTEKEIKRLCKLRDAAKKMEKAAGYKMGEL